MADRVSDVSVDMVCEVWSEVAASVSGEDWEVECVLDRTLFVSAPPYERTLDPDLKGEVRQKLSDLLGQGWDVEFGESPEREVLLQLGVCLPASDYTEEAYRFYREVAERRQQVKTRSLVERRWEPPMFQLNHWEQAGETGGLYVVEVWCRKGCCFVGYYIGCSSNLLRRAWQHYTNDEGWANEMVWKAYQAGMLIKFYKVWPENNETIEAVFIHSADSRVFNIKHILMREQGCGLCVAGFGSWASLKMPIYGTRPDFVGKRPCLSCENNRLPNYVGKPFVPNRMNEKRPTGDRFR